MPPLARLLPILTVDDAANLLTAELSIDAQHIGLSAELADFAARSVLSVALADVESAPWAAERSFDLQLSSKPPTAVHCQDAFDELLGQTNIRFTTGKAEIRASSYALLDRLVGVANDCDVRFMVAGHTDSRGSAALNEFLSLERARAVRQYLSSQGVDGSRIQAKGFGANQPIGDNTTVAGRAQNRRIEFRVIRTDS
jgi:OOP family OmpA-OmpF porin